MSHPTRQTAIDAVIGMGAAMAHAGRKMEDFNPYADSTAERDLREAFAYGWKHSRRILWEHTCPGQPLPPPNSLIW